jgi:two-component system NtrC family sensor kinase
MPDGGRLIVRTEPVGGGRVEVSFIDTGCGIPQENIEKIFEPFYTTKERGTGLGLAITRQIIEQHHGEITIESTPGTGTTVRVTLPIEHEEL